MAAGAGMDDRLRAFDVETGKQYLVIAAGAHGEIGTKLGDGVLAFTLP